MNLGVRISGDSQGSLLIGLLEPKVLYARFERTISAELGAQFSRTFTSLMGSTRGAHIFVDASKVARYDLLAVAAISEAVLSKRQQFDAIVARPSTGRLRHGSWTLAGALARVEYVNSAAEFDERLKAVAPRGFRELEEFLGALPRATAAARV